MDFSTSLKDGMSGRKPPTIKITIVKADPLLSDGQRSTGSLQTLERSPRSSPMEEDESTLSGLPVIEKLRSSTRRKKILWQHTVPEQSSKVQYVNVATAASISPREDRQTKSTPGSGGISTTPSPVEEGTQTFTEAISDRLLSVSSDLPYSSIARDKLPLAYQQPVGSPKNSTLKLKLPRRSVDNLQSVTSEPPLRTAVHSQREKKVRSLASFIDTTSRGGDAEAEELPKVVEESQGTEREAPSPMIRKLFLLAEQPKKASIRNTF